MNIIKSQFPSIQAMQDSIKNGNHVKPNNTAASFEEILLGKAGKPESTLKFSKHASGRLEERNIDLTDEQLARLVQGKEKAEAKGINESLVIVDKLAFIVNVPNSTVVTAMDSSETNENVYTNIDGAVII